MHDGLDQAGCGGAPGEAVAAGCMSSTPGEVRVVHRLKCNPG